MNEIRELPRYKSHKIVEAMKIGSIHETLDDPPSTFLLAEGPEGEPVLNVVVTEAYVAQHQPMAGGYHVRYPDGYESWSPAEAFEEGYTLVEEPPKDVAGKTPAQKPTIGSIVQYNDGDNGGIYKWMAAIIIHVHDAAMVNLVAWDRHGRMRTFKTNKWRWPPRV